MIDFYTLKYSTYARIVTGKMTMKIGKKSFDTVNLRLLGSGSNAKLLQAWAEIGVKISEFDRSNNPNVELVEQYGRMNDQRLGILICLRVLQDRESAPAIEALRRLGVMVSDDRTEAFKTAKARYTGISGNLEELEQELKTTNQKPPTYKDYVREFNIVNEQLGGSMRFSDVLLVEYIDNRQLIKQRNDRD